MPAQKKSTKKKKTKALDILQIGDPLFQDTANPVRATGIKNKAIQKIIKDLMKALEAHKLQGLTAPQIGHMHRILVFTPTREKEPLIVVNPVLMEKSKRKELFWENDPSVMSGNMYGLISRNVEVEVIGFDTTGKKITKTFTDNDAREFQRLRDVLEGRFFIERIQEKHMNMLCDTETWEKHYKKDWKKPKKDTSK